MPCAGFWGTTMARPTEAAEPKPKPAGIEFYGGYQVYSESGVDLTLLRENLKRSVTERMENNRRAVAHMEALRASSAAAQHDLKRRGKPVMFDPEALLRTLADHAVQFVVVGGQAMVAL